MAKMWLSPIFLKFTRNIDIDLLNRFGRPEIVKINFGAKKVRLTSGATWHTNTLGAKTKDHAPINGLPDGQSSWNFAGSLLASILNKCDPYWVNPNNFWKQIFLAYLTRVTWYGKNVTFTDFLEIHQKHRHWPVKPIWPAKNRSNELWTEKSPLDRLVPILDNFLTLVPSHGPRPN